MVERNRDATSIGMAVMAMAPFLASQRKPVALKGGNQFAGRNRSRRE